MSESVLTSRSAIFFLVFLKVDSTCCAVVLGVRDDDDEAFGPDGLARTTTRTRFNFLYKLLSLHSGAEEE